MVHLNATKVYDIPIRFTLQEMVDFLQQRGYQFHHEEREFDYEPLGREGFPERRNIPVLIMVNPDGNEIEGTMPRNYEQFITLIPDEFIKVFKSHLLQL